MRYDKTWSHLPSVTEILDVMNKPNLIYWLKSKTPQEIDEESQKSKKIGNIVHEAIGKILKNEEINIETEYFAEVSNCLKSFLRWKESLQIKVIECELKMKSDVLGYKGTLDHILKVGDEIWLIDWKTIKTIKENVIYPSYILQVIGYKKLYEVNGGKIDRYFVGMFEKEGNNFYIHEVKVNEQLAWKIFVNLLEIYKWLKGDKC